MRTVYCNSPQDEDEDKLACPHEDSQSSCLMLICARMFFHSLEVKDKILSSPPKSSWDVLMRTLWLWSHEDMAISESLKKTPKWQNSWSPHMLSSWGHNCFTCPRGRGLGETKRHEDEDSMRTPDLLSSVLEGEDKRTRIPSLPGWQNKLESLCHQRCPSSRTHRDNVKTFTFTFARQKNSVFAFPYICTLTISKFQFQPVIEKLQDLTISISWLESLMISLRTYQRHYHLPTVCLRRS